MGEETVAQTTIEKIDVVKMRPSYQTSSSSFSSQPMRSKSGRSFRRVSSDECSLSSSLSTYSESIMRPTSTTPRHMSRSRSSHYPPVGVAAPTRSILSSSLEPPPRCIPELSCRCGASVDFIDSSQGYGGGGINCDICNKSVRGYVYHCPRERVDEHPDGYDVCQKCARIEHVCLCC